MNYAINQSYGGEFSCIYSDYNASNLVFRIRLNSNAFNKTKKQKGIASSLDQSDEIYLLRNFQETLLQNIVLRGITNIQNVTPRKVQNSVKMYEGKYIQNDIWVLDTVGTNLLHVLAYENIDYTRTISNDIKEVFNILGIEAARQVIYDEFVEVMEFSGVYINYHHLSLLCDRMTSNAGMVPIFRSGILGDDIGPISKSTFESHTEVFLNAARHAEFDHMRGVSANVMMGQMGIFGTGSFQLVLDMEKMSELEDNVVSTTTAQNEIDKSFGLLDNINDSCSKMKIEINNNASAIKPVDNGSCVIYDDNYDIGF